MSVGEMQFIQAIPFVCVFAFFLLNLSIKRKFFSISSLSLLYVSLAMLGAVFLVEKPRTGFPYVRLDAMIFLSVCFSLLCLPALFFKDGKKNEKMPFVDLPDNVVRFVTWALCILTVPASIFYLCRSMPLLLKYVTSNVSRSEFRNSLPELGSNFSSFESFFAKVGCSFSLLALFWAVYCFSFKKRPFWIILVLFFGSLAQCFDTLKTVSRSTLFQFMVFSGITGILFYQIVPKLRKKNLKKFMMFLALGLLIPFVAISVVRFKNDLAYSVMSYFATGPYSFNVDYVVRTERNVEALNGFLTMGFGLFFYDKICDTAHYTDAEEYCRNYYWGSGEKNISSRVVFDTYRSVSGAFSGEFKTAVGTFLLDYPAYIVLLVFMLMSFLFAFFFQKIKTTWSLSALILSVLYFYCLIMAPIGWAFTLKNNVFILFLICTFVFWLYVKEKWYCRNKFLPMEFAERESTLQEFKDCE